MSRRRSSTLLLVTVLVLVAVCTLAVTIGPAGIGVGDVVASLGHHLGLGGAAPERLVDAIVWQLRAPRVLTAAAVGAGLAVAGVVMQSMTRNPLADPYLLGLSSGASLGAVAVLVLGVSVALAPAAFVGAMLALLATLGLGRQHGQLSTSRTVLAGVAVAQLCTAATSVVIFWTATGDSYRDIITWLMGSLAGSTWTTTAISATALLIVGVPLVAAARRLDAFAFGETTAAALGVDVAAARWLFFGGAALLTGAMVAVSGAIGFVGLLVPHAVKAVVGTRHRQVLPAAALIGAIVLVVADTTARTAFAPRELPVGIVTALLGVPVFIALLRRREVAR